MGVTTGYFIDASPVDVGFWVNDINGYDGNENTYCYTFFTGSNNYNHGKTTNISEVFGATITQVRVAIKGKVDYVPGLWKGDIYTENLEELLGTAENEKTVNSYGDYVILATPTGGWTWTKIQKLECKAWMVVLGGARELNAIQVEVTYTGGVETKTSIGSANARINVITESDGTFNSRINIITESDGSLNARIFIIETNTTSVDITLTTSSNQNIELETVTNQNPTLTTSINQEIIVN